MYPLLTTELEEVLLGEIRVHPIRDAMSSGGQKGVSACGRTRLGLLRAQFWQFPGVRSTWTASVSLVHWLRAGACTHVFIEKLLTPMALTLPVSSSSSIFVQVSLKVTSESRTPSSAQFMGHGFSPTSGKQGHWPGPKGRNTFAHRSRPTQ